MNVRKPGRPSAADEGGVTLLELVAVVAIAAIIAVPLMGIVNQFIFLPSRWSASIAATNATRAAVRSIADDARQASQFTPGIEPDYGTFTWTDRTGYPVRSHSARYFHSAVDEELLREETVDGATQTKLIAEGIKQYADVSVQKTGGLVLASATSTRDAIRESVVIRDSISARMRVATPSAQPNPPPIRLTWDDFESGGLSGGSGWLDDWDQTGNSDVVSSDGPYEGAFHVVVRGNSGYVERRLDLSGQSAVKLRFQAKTKAFQAGDTAVLLVSEDGVTFVPARTWDSTAPDDVYQPEEVDLSSFTMTSDFYVAFDANMSNALREFFVDDLEVVREWEP